MGKPSPKTKRKCLFFLPLPFVFSPFSCFRVREPTMLHINRIERGAKQEATKLVFSFQKLDPIKMHRHTLNNVSCGRPDREKNVTASAPPMTLSRSASAKRNHASKRSWSAEDMVWWFGGKREKGGSLESPPERFRKNEQFFFFFPSTSSSTPPSEKKKKKKKKNRRRRRCFFSRKKKKNKGADFRSAIAPSEVAASAACSPASPSRRAGEAGRRQRP